MLMIFLTSGLSQLPSASTAVDDGVWHGLAYGGLAGLLLRGLAAASWKGVTASAALGAVVLAVLYGCTDELHQRFVPGRVPDIGDLIADTVGATVTVSGLWLWRLVSHASG